MSDLRQCEICAIQKPHILFAKDKTICKMCSISVGVQAQRGTRKRYITSHIDNKMCKRFIQRNFYNAPCSALEMTLC